MASLVQTGSSATSNAITRSPTFSSFVSVVGNLVTLGIFVRNTGIAPVVQSITDNAVIPNSYPQVSNWTPAFVSGGLTYWIAVFQGLLASVPSGSTKLIVTVTMTATHPRLGAIIGEVNGAVAPNFDIVNLFSNGTLAPISVPVAPVYTNELVLAYVYPGSVPVAGSGWSVFSAANDNQTLFSLPNLAAAGQQTLSIGSQSGAFWLASLVSVIGVSSVYTPPPPSGLLPAPPNYLQGTPFVSTLRIALLDIWERFPHRLIADNNKNLYTAKQLINNPNLGTRALMGAMVEYAPDLGTITWVYGGIRKGVLYQVQGQGVNAPGGIGI